MTKNIFEELAELEALAARMQRFANEQRRLIEEEEAFLDQMNTYAAHSYTEDE